MSLLAFNWDNQQNALSVLTDQLNHTLSHQGFHRVKKREWERDRRWITEGVYLSIRQAPTWDFDAHLITYFPYRPPDQESDETRFIFANANCARVVGYDDAFIKLPRYSFFIARFVRRTLREIKQSLSWFDHFATPAQCLEAGDRMYKPGCPDHRWATQYLRSVSHETG